MKSVIRKNKPRKTKQGKKEDELYKEIRKLRKKLKEAKKKQNWNYALMDWDS